MGTCRPGELQLEFITGEGGFSDVWAAKLHGSDVAVKKPNEARNTKLPPQAVARAHLRELDVLTQAGSHPNIVRLVASSSDVQQPFLVMEKMDFNLRELLEAYGPLEEGVIAHICAGIMRGIVHLIQRNIIYSDLKSMNVLLSERLDVKLCDFGLSVMMQGEHSRPARPPSVPEPMDTKVLPGTERWMAPECRAGGQPTAASDVWSLGAVIFEMCTRELPPKGANSMDTEDIKSKFLRNLVYKCTDPNAGARPTPWELLAEFERLAATAQSRAAVARLTTSLAGNGHLLCRGALNASRQGLLGGPYAPIPIQPRAPISAAGLFPCCVTSGMPPQEDESWLQELADRITTAVGDFLWSAFRLEKVFPAQPQPLNARGPAQPSPPPLPAYGPRRHPPPPVAPSFGGTSFF